MPSGLSAKHCLSKEIIDGLFDCICYPLDDDILLVHVDFGRCRVGCLHGPSLVFQLTSSLSDASCFSSSHYQITNPIRFSIEVSYVSIVAVIIYVARKYQHQRKQLCLLTEKGGKLRNSRTFRGHCHWHLTRKPVCDCLIARK